MIRKIRSTCGIIRLALITLLFPDFTKTLYGWFGQLVKIQFLPAILALNIGVAAFLIILAAVSGQIYYSVTYPLGVFQDVAAWAGKRQKKSPCSYSPALSSLRYGALVIFIITLIVGASFTTTLFTPYSAHGRIVNNLFQSVWLWGSNLFAYLAERFGSYVFYDIEVWMKSLPTFITATATFVTLIPLAWRNGRTYCNIICPAGTVLGFPLRYSLLRVTIDTDKCNGCGLCARYCKVVRISSKEHTTDYSRCVACMDCLGKCKQKAFSHQLRTSKTGSPQVKQNASLISSGQVDETRRNFLTVTVMVVVTPVPKAQGKKVDGGLAIIEDRRTPDRQAPITPPDSSGACNMSAYCMACQLCVSACPNQVLCPSTKLMNLIQPEMSYECGYCRSECNDCSQVCPAGAIRPITVADKSSTQIGYAVWVKANCIPLTDEVGCDNCARHCPTGAIQMTLSIPDQSDSPKTPVVNTECCIGCGACENFCPARPFSTIYVEGHERHRII